LVHKWDEQKHNLLSSKASTISSFVLKKKIFFEVINLETMHVNKHIGFNAPLLIAE
jgi:hypothetical protein